MSARVGMANTVAKFNQNLSAPGAAVCQFKANACFV